MPGISLVLFVSMGNLDGHLAGPTAALSENGETQALRSLGVSTCAGWVGSSPCWWRC